MFGEGCHVTASTVLMCTSHKNSRGEMKPRTLAVVFYLLSLSDLPLILRSSGNLSIILEASQCCFTGTSIEDVTKYFYVETRCTQDTHEVEKHQNIFSSDLKAFMQRPADTTLLY